MGITIPGVAKYPTSFIDDYFNRFYMYRNNRKSHVLPVIKEFKAQNEFKIRKIIKCLRINSEKE